MEPNDDLMEWVEVDGIKYATQQEVAWRIRELEAELATLQKVKRLFNWVVVRRTDGTVSIGHPPRLIMDEISAVLREMIKENE